MYVYDSSDTTQFINISKYEFKYIIHKYFEI